MELMSPVLFLIKKNDGNKKYVKLENLKAELRALSLNEFELFIVSDGVSILVIVEQDIDKTMLKIKDKLS